jgi:hypothetical protein
MITQEQMQDIFSRVNFDLPDTLHADHADPEAIERGGSIWSDMSWFTTQVGLMLEILAELREIKTLLSQK